MPDSRHLQLAMQDVHDRVGITQTNYYLLPVIGSCTNQFQSECQICKQNSSQIWVWLLLDTYRW